MSERLIPDACHACGSISSVYLEICDDCMTRLNQDRRRREAIGTHWEGCWRVHLGCAVARIERLEKTLKSC